MQSPYTAYSPVSWYNREESHSGQLYHLYKAVLSLCPEYDTSLRYYTISSAYTSSKYEGYIPTPGYDLLVAEITVKNTLPEALPMFDWDFIVLYPDTTSDEQVYDYPITSYEDVDIPQTALQTLLPSEYTLQAGESRTGLLLFEVPAGDTEFVISYIEYFDDDTAGDTFDVSVTATRR